MSKSLKKLIDINRLREFKNKLVGAGSAYVQTAAVDQTIAGTKTFSKPIVGSVTGSSGSCTGNAATATQFSANATVALTGDATGTSAGSKKGWSVPVTLANSGVTAGSYGPTADVTGNNNATISVPQITVDAKGRVTSVTNRTLTCKNNTYNVYNKTLTIQKNGTNVAAFTSNSNTDVAANITVPTKVSELTNDSGFLTSHQSLSNYVTLNGAQTISGAKTFTGNIIGINKDQSTEDANSLYSTTAGSKLTYYTTSNGGTTLTNVPAAVNTTLESRTIRRMTDSDWVVEQICHNSNGLYYRKGSNGTWGAWKTFAFTDSNISGNAATATTATTAKACTGNSATATKATQDSAGQQIDTTYIKGLAVSGRTITYTKGDGSTGTITTQDTNTWTAFKGATSSANGTAGYVPAPTKGNQDKFFKADGTWATPTNVTGNAASATKLQTARTINGIAFDGTANITIPVTAPAGVIIPFAGKSVPTGYLLCNGAAVSRTNYANLFAAIGTLYGAGNGSTTFNLPDARDRVLQGASGTHSAGSYIAAGLPNITGLMAQGVQCAAIQVANGVFYESDSRQHNAAQNNDGSSNFPAYVYFNASRSSTIYGASSTVQSPAIATNFIIKY